MASKEINQQKPKKKIGKKIIIALAVLVVIGAIVGGGDEEKVQDSKETPAAIETSNEVEPVNEEAQAIETVEEVQEPEPEEVLEHYEAELISGHYTCGVDFPAGTYDITAIGGGGNVSSSNMYSGGLNEIMGISDDDMYTKSFSNAKFAVGDVLSTSSVTIKITSDNAATASMGTRENPLTETVDLSSGNFVAGEDFSAGIYDVVAVSGGGNVSSDNMYDMGLNAIMGTESDDMYEKEYKNINLDEGVTLSVSGVNIQLVPSK